MYDSLPELSPDLEWMLESGQTALEDVASALLQEHYAPVYRLSLAVLADPILAHQVSKEIFIQSLLNIHQYRSQTGVRLWLLRIAIKVLSPGARLLKPRLIKTRQERPSPGSTVPPSRQGRELLDATRKLDFSRRVILVLRHLLGWPAEEIGLALGLQKARLAQILLEQNQMLRKLAPSVKKESGSDEDLAFHAQIQELLSEIWPAADLTPQDLEALAFEVASQAGMRAARRKRVTGVKELLVTSLVIGLVLAFVWGANVLLPEPEPTPSVSQARATAPSPPIRSRPALQDEPASTPIFGGSLYEVAPGDTLETIAARLGVTPRQLRDANRLLRRDSVRVGQILVVPDSLNSEALVQPTPVKVLPSQEPAPPPVSRMDILKLLARGSAWQTFWGDFWLVDYGPAGYIGAPRRTRLQLWISQGQMLALIGPSLSPEEAFLRKGSDLYRAQPGRSLPWFVKINPNDPFSTQSLATVNQVIKNLTGQDALDSRAALTAAGQELLNGRQAYIIEQNDPQGDRVVHLWVDAQSGLVLRSQFFAPGDPASKIKEIDLNNFAKDVNFSDQTLFDEYLPWRGGYARNERGWPLPATSLEVYLGPLPSTPSLPFSPFYPSSLDGFDPSHSRLIFHYPPDFNPGDPRAVVDLFADQTYLGAIQFGNPWTMICDRSPDGSKLAYVSQPFKSPPQDAALYWFDLTNLKALHAPVGGVYFTHLAFAPDSRWLAAFGYDGQFASGQVYLIDTQTGQYKGLLHLVDAKSFVWSPDGEYLALIGAPEVQYREEVMVMRVATGQVIFRDAIDLENSGSPEQMGANWPTASWGVEFPVEMGGLSACATPPKD